MDAERRVPFLPAEPWNLMATGQFNHVPYITGMNQNEGSFQVAGTRLMNHMPKVPAISLLLAMQGEFMDTFTSQPVTFLRYVLGLEFASNGLQVAEDIFGLLDHRRPYEDQLISLEQVQYLPLINAIYQMVSKAFKKI